MAIRHYEHAEKTMVVVGVVAVVVMVVSASW